MARIFISHSSLDDEAAARMNTWLKSQGFETTFLDFDKTSGIAPGANWEKTLYREVEQSQAVIVIQTPSWLASKWCFAEFTQARALGKAIFLVIETPTGDSQISPDVQTLNLLSDREGGLERLSREITRIALDAQGGFEWDVRRPPFPGLLAFQEEDAAIYFGRDDDIRRLIERLEAHRAQGGAKLVGLLGASGSGKSSLLRAGVIPRLKRAGRNWIVTPPVRPRLHPVNALALALAGASGPSTDWRKLKEDLLNSNPDRVLDDLANDLRVKAAASEGQILIPIDQGEELFGVADPEEAKRFLEILSLALSEKLPFMAVMAIRSDFLGQLQSTATLTARFEEFSLGPMPLTRIPQIIQGPAKVAGVNVEDAFVQQAARDAATEDALPLLAFALRDLWDRSPNKELSLDSYQSLGDAKAGLSPLENAVREAAEAVLAEARPADDELSALRDAFVPAMVRVNDQGEYVRRPARLDGLPAKAQPLLDKLAKARLLIVRQDGDDRIVEVAHEALLRKWPLLRSWLDAARLFLIGKQQLEQDLRDWEGAAENDKAGALLTGLKLNRARGWLIEHPFQLTQREQAFVQASIQSAEVRERQKAKTRRLVTFGALAAALVLAVVASLAGFEAWQTSIAQKQSVAAEKTAKDNAARAIAALSEAAQANSRVAQVQRIARQTGDPFLPPQRGLLLAVYAATLQPRSGAGLLGAIDGVRQQLFAAGGLLLDGQVDSKAIAAYSSDGHWLASSGADGQIRLRDLTAPDPGTAVHILTGHRGPVTGIAFGADSRHLVSAGNDGTVRSWRIDAASPVAGRVISVSALGPIRSLAASPDGQWLAFGTDAGQLCLWRWLADGPEEAPCDPAWRDKLPVTTILFSPKGRWLATTCTGACKDFNAPVRLWDLSLKGADRGPKLLVPHSALAEPSLLAIAFSPDETRLAAAYGYVAELWDLTQPDPPANTIGTYSGGGGWITTLDISADDQWFALGSGGSNDVRLWRLTNEPDPPSTPKILSGHGGPVTVVRFGGGGRWLASAAADGSLNLWDPARPERGRKPLRWHDQPIGGLRFSPEEDPRYLLSWATGERARLWRLPEPGVDPLVLRGSMGPMVAGMAVSTDGRLIASSSQDDNLLALWSTEDTLTPPRMLPLPGFASSIAFSRDGRWMAAKSQNLGLISLWNLRDLDQPPLVMQQEGWSDGRTLAFSPDSRWLASGTFGEQGLRPRWDLWDVSSDTPQLEPRYRCSPRSPVRELAFSDNGKFLASAAHDRAAYLWDITSGNPCSTQVALLHGDVVYQVSLSGDGRFAATASMDRTGRLWELAPGTPPKLLREIYFEDRVVRAVFSPDNRWVAFASWDRTAALLDLRAPATSPPVVLRGHVGRILVAGFSPDSQWLATAGDDWTVRLWRPDAPSAAPVVLRGHEQSVAHLGFTPDGRWLVSGAYDGTIRLWRLRLDDLVKMACATAGRTLTADEVELYLGSAPTDACVAR
ncbi:TIR domain-containing protein (plasmid) [Rhizobium leguminosarum bv. trifolii]|uniref:nSTAND1 domain-containing NTPase n=1 Tax=Rhizobium ruizarguesonis TaxID=2081791 RepID=UPI00103095C2|nr:TIR domain-containing protein [Rhizobium ruizarguesonis]QIO48709.1 TIR domain-containing protein [Rhizobium leguminosarum bv. trifolii]TAW38305.1 TIR domain-containing protein [Rhizobium ruizarguesonis]TAY06363.1 TIR domain-containing protein [Rhizobium ruizarguesonis]